METERFRDYDSLINLCSVSSGLTHEKHEKLESMASYCVV